jgi:hypothetical protein
VSHDTLPNNSDRPQCLCAGIKLNDEMIVEVLAAAAGFDRDEIRLHIPLMVRGKTISIFFREP